MCVCACVLLVAVASAETHPPTHPLASMEKHNEDDGFGDGRRAENAENVAPPANGSERKTQQQPFKEPPVRLCFPPFRTCFVVVFGLGWM